MTKYTFFMLTVFFFACSSDSGTGYKKLKDNTVSLDSLAEMLFKKYPNFSRPQRNKSPSTVYSLISRHFYPSLDSLTFELRQYTDCGGCWEHQFIYIYNDSTEFILPLIDNYYFWLLSSNKQINIDSLKNKFCLQTEINDAIGQFNLKDNQTSVRNEKFVDVIMDLMGYQPVYSWDIPKMKEFSKSITQDSFLYNKNCKIKFLDNLQTIESELSNHKNDSKIYSNLWITYIVDFRQPNINLTVLNFECNAHIIF